MPRSPECLFPTDISSETLHKFLVPLMHTICPANLTVLDL
jgi:hypothetical protein